MSLQIFFCKGLDQLLKFLQTDNHELLRTSTGVFVNLMADGDKREALRNNQGVSRFDFPIFI